MTYNLVRRGKIWHARIWMNGNEVWRSTGTTDKGAAQAEAERIKMRLMTADKGCPAGETSSEDVFEAYKAYLDRSMLNAKYVQNAKNRIGRFLAFAQVGHLSALINTHWDAFADSIKRDMSRNNVRKFYDDIRTFLIWATRNPSIAEPYMLVNPLRGVKAPTKTQKEIKYLEFEQIVKVLAWIRERYPNTAFLRTVSLAAHTGARANELRHARWQDVDLKRMKIVIRRPKSGKERTIYFSATLRDDLLPGAQKEGLIIGTNKIPGNQRAWRKMLKELELDISFHGLRHSYITALIKAGVNVKVIMILAGHCNINTTLRYVHATDKDVEAAGRILKL